MSKKTAAQLIEEQVSEMGDMYMDSDVSYYYRCMETGLGFETFGEPASYSPFTGSPDIMAEEASSKDFEQSPQGQNPVPSKGGIDWKTKQTAANSAPSDKNPYGATSPDGKGFLPFSGTSN